MYSKTELTENNFIPENVLQLMNFKKIVEGESYWYELKFKNHRFITNDNSFNQGKDEWCIGYDNTDKIVDTIWLDNKINTHKKFTDFFEIVTDCLFSLNGCHKKISSYKSK